MLTIKKEEAEPEPEMQGKKTENSFILRDANSKSRTVLRTAVILTGNSHSEGQGHRRHHKG